MYKNLNIGAAAATALVGTASKARIRVRDGALQVRFTERTSLVNLPKDEQVRNVTVKGSGRRVGLPSAFGTTLEVGGKVALVPGKYGWFDVQPAAGDLQAAGSISA